MDRDLEFIQEARNLLQAAHEAWLKFENFTEEQVERVLLEILKATFPCLAQRAGYRDFNVAIGAGCVMHIRYMIGVGVSLDAMTLLYLARGSYRFGCAKKDQSVTYTR